MMGEQEKKCMKIYEKVKVKKFIDNILDKISEIAKDNEDKDKSKYAFFISTKAWEGIAKKWGVDLNEETIHMLAWRGFRIYGRSSSPLIYFGKLYLPKEIDENELREETIKILKKQ